MRKAYSVSDGEWTKKRKWKALRFQPPESHQTSVSSRLPQLCLSLFLFLPYPPTPTKFGSFSPTYDLSKHFTLSFSNSPKIFFTIINPLVIVSSKKNRSEFFPHFRNPQNYSQNSIRKEGKTFRDQNTFNHSFIYRWENIFILKKGTIFKEANIGWNDSREYRKERRERERE